MRRTNKEKSNRSSNEHCSSSTRCDHRQVSKLPSSSRNHRCHRHRASNYNNDDDVLRDNVNLNYDDSSVSTSTTSNRAETASSSLKRNQNQISKCSENNQSILTVSGVQSAETGKSCLAPKLSARLSPPIGNLQKTDHRQVRENTGKSKRPYSKNRPIGIFKISPLQEKAKLIPTSQVNRTLPEIPIPTICNTKRPQPLNCREQRTVEACNLATLKAPVGASSEGNFERNAHPFSSGGVLRCSGGERGDGRGVSGGWIDETI